MPLVVFVTAFDTYALKAFDVHALDYLLKPFDRERFLQALARARQQLERATDGDLGAACWRWSSDLEPAPPRLERFVIKSGGRVFFVRADEIDWIEAAGNYVKLHVGTDTHLFRETMNAVEAQLPPETFYRIHRCHIVNIERVKELQPWFNGEYVVFLRTGARLTLSRGYREKLQESHRPADLSGSVASPAARAELLELLGVRRPAVRLAPVDQALAHQPRQRFLERERPVLARDGDLLVQVLQRVLANVLARAVADHQQFRRRHQAAAGPAAAASASPPPPAPSPAPGGWCSAARPETSRRCARPSTRHRSCAAVESTRCPVSAAASAIRIVSGSRISPITITSGAWRSAARSAVGKSGASMPISTCSMMLRVMRVLVLDRILDGDDVAGVAAVDLVDDRRQRGRLAGAGRAADEHQAARQLRELLDAAAAGRASPAAARAPAAAAPRPRRGRARGAG